MSESENKVTLDTGLEYYSSESVYTLTLHDYAPEKTPDETDSLFYRFWQAHQDQFDRHGRALGGIALSSNILYARGDDLDQIGKKYGKVGKRRKRGDGAYRQFLLGISNAFKGTGTVQDIKFAVGASVISSDPESVIPEEYPEYLQYGLTLKDWESHETDVPVEIADLADASAVSLREPIDYRRPDAEMVLDVSQSTTEEIDGRDPAVFEFDLETRQTEVVTNKGFGAGYFDGEDPFGEEYDEFGGPPREGLIRMKSASIGAEGRSPGFVFGDPIQLGTARIDTTAQSIASVDPGPTTAALELSRTDTTGEDPSFDESYAFGEGGFGFEGEGYGGE